jgi:hypothetical protein
MYTLMALRQNATGVTISADAENITSDAHVLLALRRKSGSEFAHFTTAGHTSSVHDFWNSLVHGLSQRALDCFAAGEQRGGRTQNSTVARQSSHIRNGSTRRCAIHDSFYTAVVTGRTLRLGSERSRARAASRVQRLTIFDLTQNREVSKRNPPRD